LWHETKIQAGSKTIGILPYPEGQTASTNTYYQKPKLGQGANLGLSAHVLRHTCLTNLVRGGNDLVGKLTEEWECALKDGT
jgi:hypothetical protein